jgi:hypothetical protein
MKRQFKASVQAKHEVKNLKKQLENMEIVRGLHVQDIVRQADEIGELEYKLDILTGAKKMLENDFETVKKHNIEQKAELWKVKKANNQLENEIEKVKKSLETHKEILRTTQNEDYNTIQDLKLENNELKKRVILFAGALLAMCFVAMWGL